MSILSEKLSLVREAMYKNHIDAYIIPSADPHINEYVPDHWRIIKWLTGFSGSNATVVITESFAGLWTDSRYFIQADEQIAGSGFSLFKPLACNSNDYADFLADTLKSGSRIGFDGRIFSVTRLRLIKSRLSGLKINIDTECDLISGLWHDRPALPESEAFDLPLKYCGRERERKLSEVRSKMRAEGVSFILLTTPEDIMWLLNIRGRDHIYNPVISAFALLGMQQVLLFVNDKKIPFKLASDFDRLGIVILPYDETAGLISSLSGKSVILISPGCTSVSLYNSIPERYQKKEGISIPAKLKAVKNKTEVENISNVMVRDGAALTKFFYWLEKHPELSALSEVSLAEKLLEFRSSQEDFLGNSFASIVAFNEHSALPHYDPSEGKASTLEEEGILLIDSGGHYQGGTTDITRTISTGNPSEKQKKDFTLVLKGHINLAASKFPAGTRGYQLDILARKALWENGLNYGHGTGHGVGFCLNVHEGPQNISPSANKTIIEPGMIISNEPAIYREGEYGIRTENLLLCYEDEETDFGQFLRFETMSLCYIDKSLIDLSLLTSEEILWLNRYHQEVYDRLSSHLTDNERRWHRGKTEAIGNVK